MTHNFKESLDKSNSVSDLPIWWEIYSKAFVGFTTMADLRKDGDHQRVGIDRCVVLSNGKAVYIDEKVRFKAFDDIALEEWSVDKKKLGWAEKPLWCDYIAYAIIPKATCYLLPVIMMQNAWKINKEKWKLKYRRIVAHNQNYDTISWGIPIDVLFKSIGEQLRIQFTI